MSTKKDLWDKADILSKFLSSIIIAVIGLYITYTIQQHQINSTEAIANSQLELTKLNAEKEIRLNEAKLTGQLMQYLTSKDSKERKIAVLTLKKTLQRETYDELIQIVAIQDDDKDVRVAAIKKLGESENVQVVEVLSKIAQDVNRDKTERNTALKSNMEVEFRTSLPPNSYIIGAGEIAVEASSLGNGGGLFNHFLVKGLKGEADSDEDGYLDILELFSFVRSHVQNFAKERYYHEQIPSISLNTKELTLLNSSSYKKVHCLIIGINKTNNKEYLDIQFAVNDAKNIAKTMIELYPNSAVDILVDIDAKSIKSNLKKIIESTNKNDLFVFYYAGHGVLDKRGKLRMLSTETKKTNLSAYISLDDIKRQISNSKAKTNLILIGACGASSETINEYNK